ncbi:CocE/NonD family hydrolase [Phyllobacterium sp. SB3]|uniref:CocE/NonD family hydrolase n=1 Tax=Phyllobacterium sp. SB3 TaxID=3156073 RepID=UPI0032AFE20E
MKSSRFILCAMALLAACDGSSSNKPNDNVSDNTFDGKAVPVVTDNTILEPNPTPAPAVEVKLESQLPIVPATTVPIPTPLPEIGKQFETSPTGIAYPKLATLYPGRNGPVVEDGMILPWLSKRAPLKSAVKVLTDMDTDGDGQKDKIALRIVQPAEVTEGLKTPVIVRPSIYYEDSTYETDSRGPFLGEAQYLRMGFTIVYADSLGSNQSDGCPSIMDGTEREAMADVVRWLVNDPNVKGMDASGRAILAPWSTGHVAMEGVSYGATLATMAAATGVAGLEAIVPVAGISNAYDYFQRYNGVQIGDVVDLNGYAGEYTSAIRKTACSANKKKLDQGVDDLTFAYNDFWKERNTLLLVNNIKAATLIAHGQSDNNVKTKNSVQLYDTLFEMKKPVQLWLHSRDHDDPAWQKEWQKQILLWYSRYLFGVNNGVEKQDTYVREIPAGDLIAGNLIMPDRDDTSDTLIAHCSASAHSPRDCIPAGELLVKEPAWPKTDVVPYYLLRDSTAKLLLTVNATEGNTKIPVRFNAYGNSGAFGTAPLENATRFAGTIRVKINASYLAGVPNLKATLFIDGARVTWGWANPSFYKGLEKEEIINEGENYPLVLEMMPRDFTVLPGSKISVFIEGAYHPRRGGAKETTLDLSQTTLEMPVVKRAIPSTVMMLN